MRLFCLLLLVLLPVAIQAQRTRPARMAAVPLSFDSQQVWLRRPALPDTTRVKLLLSRSLLHQYTHVDSARWYGEQALGLARRSHYAWGEAYALITLGAAHYYASDYPAAQRTFEQAVRATRAVGQPEFVGHAYLGLGNVATELHNAPAAEKFFAQAQQAYASCRPRFVNGEQLVLYNRANGYLDAEQPGRARALVQQGLALLRQYPQAGRLAKFELLLGTVQRAQHHPDSAVASWQRSARHARTSRDVQAEGEAWRNLGELSREQQRWPAALAYARRAKALFRSLGDPSLIAETLNTEAAALAALRRPEAYDTLRRYVSLRDTLLSQQRVEAVATAQARFDQREQRARIRALEQQRRIAGLQAAQRTTRSRLLLGGGLGAALLLAGGAVGFYRQRQRRREAALRHQLAADLHDDVGGLLARISLQADLLQEGLTPVGQQPAQWAEVASNSRQAVRHLNDVVWNLDAQNDTVPNLLNRLRDYTHEVLEASGRDVRFVGDATPDAAAELPAAVRRHLYLVYKEALHNVLKHAPADAPVRVRLHQTGRTLHLAVVNDGPVLAAPSGRTSGHGLRNIQARAAVLGGTAQLGPEPDGGFAVRVSVPV